MRKTLLASFSVLILVIFASCGSKPAPEPETVPEPPATENVQENPPEENPQPAETPAPADNSAIMETIESARQSAVEAGAERDAAEQLDSADGMYQQLKEKSDRGDDISGEGSDIADRYNAITAYIKAKNAKQKIDENSLSSYLQAKYDEGEILFEEFKAAYSDPASGGKLLLEKAEKAYSAYNSVLIAAYKTLAKNERADAYSAKKDADSVKAGVSQKEKYFGAVELFKNADAMYSMQNPEKAYYDYKSAKEIFAELYGIVSERRAAAQKAIDEAKKKVEDSAGYADDADQKAPITGTVDGIEDEDAVLLEADNYDAQDMAETEIPESIDGEADGSISAGENASATENAPDPENEDGTEETQPSGTESTEEGEN